MFFLVLAAVELAVAADVAPVNISVPKTVSTWVFKLKNCISVLKPILCLIKSEPKSSASSSKISPKELFQSCFTTCFLPCEVATLFKLSTKPFFIALPPAVLNMFISGIIAWTLAVTKDIPFA